MLFGAAHAGGQVLQAIHVQAAAAVAGGLDAVAPLQLFHARDHLGLVGSAVVEAVHGGGFDVGEQGGRGVGDRDGGGGVEERGFHVFGRRLRGFRFGRGRGARGGNGGSSRWLVLHRGGAFAVGEEFAEQLGARRCRRAVEGRTVDDGDVGRSRRVMGVAVMRFVRSGVDGDESRGRRHGRATVAVSLKRGLSHVGHARRGLRTSCGHLLGREFGFPATDDGVLPVL